MTVYYFGEAFKEGKGTLLMVVEDGIGYNPITMKELDADATALALKVLGDYLICRKITF